MGSLFENISQRSDEFEEIVTVSYADLDGRANAAGLHERPF
jgi:hypothetical protein